ncbi:glycoside hydrolase family 20 zincin-like fold domain-containing protein [Lysinibacter cavernae]|uniref:Beta-hexosaminidase bacterial type N-terminal domain-containing protein n=1 Tax=Lysinibacter cavernae TaxID=1640652 RepID=A0A7X5TTM4_9MICO|nr:hypothetical protein [Lysinibacter cavernae]NIH54786.1 hypothetical protein [Lysinibacter cavernae]
MTSNATLHLSSRVALQGADEHPHAAARLREEWADLDWIEARQGESIPSTMPTVLLTASDSLEEGAFRISVETNGTQRITVTGGPYSGVIYGVEELVQRIAKRVPNGISVEAGITDRKPALAYRTFWTWDHSTNWELNQIGHQEIGVFNPYGKPPQGFLRDYQRMVDFCSKHQISAIVIYGMLRDSHGGIPAAQELCDYGKYRGVRVIPGLAIGAYGGVYWEGDHKYNLATWLAQNPEFAAEMERGVGFQLKDLSFPLNFPKSDYTRTACPSRPESIAWMEDSISWLVDTLRPGGINVEGGDYGVCGCALCIKRRGDRELASRRDHNAEFWSHADMADNFPRLFNAAKSIDSDLWVYCELQWDNLLDEDAHEPLSTLPKGGIYQHTFNRSYWDRMKTELTSAQVAALPTKTNVIRSQFACQWNGDDRTERYAFNAPVFAELSKKAEDVSMQGLTVWGEPSPYNVSSELSYLAFGRFGYDSSLTWADFVASDIAPRVGGAGEAEAFISLMQEMDANQFLDVGRLTAIRDEALSAASSQSGEAVRRWLWLSERANQRVYMGY